MSRRIVDHWTQIYAHRVLSLKSSAARDLMAMASRPDIISFAGGLPSPETFDFDLVEKISSELLEKNGEKSLQYGPTEGIYELREQICKFMARSNIKAHPDNVIITSGAQQALDLLGKLFLDKGSEAIIESPSYVGALNAFRIYEPNLISVELEEDGIDVASVEKILKEKSTPPKFVYVVPNFHNPAGVTLSNSKRKKLVRICQEYDVIIIEDNPYGDLCYEGKELPPLKILDDQIIYLGTLSKILSPGLRVGWVCAPASLIQSINAAKQGADLCSSSFSQLIATRFLQEVSFDKHVENSRNIYRKRLKAMISAMEEFFPQEAYWTEPRGGFFVWATVDAEINTTDMLSEALSKKVAYIPGEAFYDNGEGFKSMRLSFSNPNTEEIWDGIERLASVLKEQISLSRTILGKSQNKGSEKKK